MERKVRKEEEKTVVVLVETLKEVTEDGPTFYGGIFQTRPYVVTARRKLSAYYPSGQFHSVV